jgi:OmpA-OmpF porin, OOP family
MKKLILFSFLLSMMFSLNAQTTQKNKFTPNLYLATYGGLSAFIGENNTPFQSGNDFSFKNNIKWGCAIAVGAEFTPLFGIRGELGYQQNKWEKENKYYLESLTVDGMFNATNLILGFNPQRCYDIQAFIGGGVGIVDDLISFERGDILTPIVRVGLQGSYHFNKNIDFHLELATNAVTDNYNGLKGGLFFDNVSSLMVGVSYHFR